MGRGRVQLKRIENKTSQQVTFFKRRTGLLKKANEISVLCDAQVALIMFSTKGKLFEYSSAPSMEDILEKYERQNHTELTGAATNETQGNWTFEYMKLTAKVQVLERNLRNFVGHDLDPLSVKELQSLEQQLDTSLKRIRTRKNQVMNQSISELHKRARALQEQNSKLAKTKEKEKMVNEHPQRCIETIGIGQGSSTLNLGFQPQVLPPQRLVPSLSLSGAIQARGSLEFEETGEAQTVPINNNNNLIPAWMLQHLTN
ncbi:truncated transcription factor CAULIFLOWER A-like [Vicia villosa]|uniref:truncated transcription factor CAULIFLOWER A-like n=1 Tax=Vicia villosa TaxID=3911 RepID=UPI00273B28F0|nr:truncated transcription factor CAULIFLOWER A-like [Vicia villosa]